MTNDMTRRDRAGGVPDGMRAVSVHQPWASAIVWAGKDVENRTWRTSFRGWLAVCATRRPADLFAVNWMPLWRADDEVWQRLFWCCPTGVLLGVVRLIDVHCADSCLGMCSLWAETTNVAYHWELADPRPVDDAGRVAVTGRQGLWRLPNPTAEGRPDGDPSPYALARATADYPRVDGEVA